MLIHPSIPPNPAYKGIPLRSTPDIRVYPYKWGWVNFLNLPKMTTPIYKDIPLYPGENSNVVMKVLIITPLVKKYTLW